MAPALQARVVARASGASAGGRAGGKTAARMGVQTAQQRRLLSPATQELLGRRLAELSGLAMAMGAIAVLVALATYNPRDPSMNTATSRATTNLGWAAWRLSGRCLVARVWGGLCAA